MGPKINRLNVGDRVKRVSPTLGRSFFLDITGSIEGLGTELGDDYVSVRWDGNTSAFCAQVSKEDLIKVG